MQVDQVTREMRAQISAEAREEARAGVAAVLTALKAKVRGHRDSQREASDMTADLREQIASKDQQLKKARDEERRARQERQRLQEEKDAWDLEQVWMHDEITRKVRGQEERRAAKQARAEIERVGQELQTQLREKDNYIEGPAEGTGGCPLQGVRRATAAGEKDSSASSCSARNSKPTGPAITSGTSAAVTLAAT